MSDSNLSTQEKYNLESDLLMLQISSDHLLVKKMSREYEVSKKIRLLQNDIENLKKSKDYIYKICINKIIIYIIIYKIFHLAILLRKLNNISGNIF